jgi:hypothetical protein
MGMDLRLYHYLAVPLSRLISGITSVECYKEYDKRGQLTGNTIQEKTEYIITKENERILKDKYLDFLYNKFEHHNTDYDITFIQKYEYGDAIIGKILYSNDKDLITELDINYIIEARNKLGEDLRREFGQDKVFEIKLYNEAYWW